MDLRRPLRWTAAALAVPAAFAAAQLGLRGRALPPGAPAVATPPRLSSVPAFVLTEASGRRFSSKELRGPYLASFLFTRCAGVCPMVTDRMKSLSKGLAGVRLISFTVDPADSPAVLAAWAKAQGVDWTLLAGKPGQVRRLSEEGFRLAASGPGTPREPFVHSAHLVLVDGDGNVRGYYDTSDPRALERLPADARAVVGERGS